MIVALTHFHSFLSLGRTKDNNKTSSCVNICRDVADRDLQPSFLLFFPFLSDAQKFVTSKGTN